MWKEAIFYSNLVFQFGITFVLAYFAGAWLGQRLGWPRLDVVFMLVFGPLAFWLFMRQLERRSVQDRDG